MHMEGLPIAEMPAIDPHPGHEGVS
jgi:hypothetical protein